LRYRCIWGSFFGCRQPCRIMWTLVQNLRRIIFLAAGNQLPSFTSKGVIHTLAGAWAGGTGYNGVNLPGGTVGYPAHPRLIRQSFRPSFCL
jgi:hypothetical protein